MYVSIYVTYIIVELISIKPTQSVEARHEAIEVHCSLDFAAIYL